MHTRVFVVIRVIIIYYLLVMDITIPYIVRGYFLVSRQFFSSFWAYDRRRYSINSHKN